jgi:hypothetical protein
MKMEVWQARRRRLKRVVRMILAVHIQDVVESFLDGQLAKVGKLTGIHEEAMLRADFVKDMGLLGIVDGFHRLLTTRAIYIADFVVDHAQELITIIDRDRSPVITQQFCLTLVELDSGTTFALVDDNLPRLDQESLFGQFTVAFGAFHDGILS